MAEPSSITPPIKPDTSAQVSAVRYAAMALAAIALVGFVVWAATGGDETRLESAASIARASEHQRSLFREEKGGIYVATPDGASAETSFAARHPTQQEFVRRNDAPAIVASLPPPKRKPLLLSADIPTPPQLQPQPQPQPQPSRDATAPPEPTSAGPTTHEPYESRAVEAVQDESTMDEPPQAEFMTDEAMDEPPPSDSMMDDPMWDEPPSDEQMFDEPDEPNDDDD